MNNIEPQHLEQENGNTRSGEKADRGSGLLGSKVRRGSGGHRASRGHVGRNRATLRVSHGSRDVGADVGGDGGAGARGRGRL